MFDAIRPFLITGPLALGFTLVMLAMFLNESKSPKPAYPYTTAGSSAKGYQAMFWTGVALLLLSQSISEPFARQVSEAAPIFISSILSS
jgi:hypothetical protein